MIENYLAYNIRDIELGCKEDCPKLKELEEKYEEMLAEWETDVECWKKSYPDEELPDELQEPPSFPECDGCEYEWLKKEEKELTKAMIWGDD
jgi:hypothetical protein